MILNILIPYYNEPTAVLDNLLTSIARQQGVDFKEVVVSVYNDGGDELPLDLFKGRPFKSFYHEGNHLGISATRNRLLDLSTADYIMCCDADDVFTDMFGLSYVFKAMRKGFDVFNSSFYEEGCKKNGDRIYIIRKDDIHFIHGKAFRRKYLVDNNIRWKEEYRYSGDTFFLGLALRTSKKHLYCSTPFYMWKWNPSSICRREKNHYEKEFDLKIKVVSSLIDELMIRNMKEDARYYALFVTYDAYYVMQSDGWETLNEDEKISRIKMFKDFYNEYRDMIDSADKKTRIPIVRMAKNNQFYRGNIMEKITYMDWLDKIIMAGGA